MMRAISAGVVYFLAVFAIGFVLGVIRTFYVVPAVGPSAAVMLELPVILLAAWVICRAIVRRAGIAGVGDAAAMGATAFVLLMIGEAAVSTLVVGRSLAQHFMLYGEAHQLLGLAGQVLFALFPLLQIRR
jgi:hypothetical protein